MAERPGRPPAHASFILNGMNQEAVRTLADISGIHHIMRIIHDHAPRHKPTSIGSIIRRRPAVAMVFHIVQRAVVMVSDAGCREEYGLVGIGELVVEMPSHVPSAFDVVIGRVSHHMALAAEAGMGTGWGYLEADRAGIIDGLDDLVVGNALSRLV